MTPETERRIRSLAADKVDLRQRVELLREANIHGQSRERQQEMMGDLKVAERALYECEAELNELTMSRREA